MEAEEQRRLYRQGIGLFNQGRYFEAHEVWEELWHVSMGDKHRFIQGLIQAAVALEHLRRGNGRGVRSLHKTYPGKFAGLGERFMGLEVGRFLEQMERALKPALDEPADSPRPPRLDPAATPQIPLGDDDVQSAPTPRP